MPRFEARQKIQDRAETIKLRLKQDQLKGIYEAEARPWRGIRMSRRGKTSASIHTSLQCLTLHVVNLLF